MDFVVPFVYLVFMTGNLTLFFKKRFEEMLPSAIMLSGLILYLTAFGGKLSIGFYILILGSICFPLILLTQKVRKKEISDYLDRILTPGFFVFCIIYLLIFFLNLNRGFTEWDEFSHWGPMVKEILRLDTFYSDPKSKSLVHQDYPPVIALVEVLWCKFSELFGNGYSERTLYRALQTFILSMYIPTFKNTGGVYATRKFIFVSAVLYSLLLLSLQLIIPLGEAKIYSTIYIDGAMAIVFAYSVFIITTNKCFDKGYYFQATIALTFLLLTKQMGLVLYLLAVGIFVINILFNKQNREKFKCVKRNFYVILSFFVIPMFVSNLWSVYVRKLGIKGQFSISSIRINTLLDIMSGNGGEEWQHIAWVNFMDRFCHAKLNSSPVSLTYWQLIIVLGSLLFVVGRLSKNISKRKHIYLLDACLIGGGIAYAGAMMLTYLYAFGEYEGTRIVCYDRYMGTYIFAFLSLIVMIAIDKSWRENKNVCIYIQKIGIVLVVILFFLLPTRQINQLRPALTNTSVAKDLFEDAERINANTNEDARIYLISQWNNGYDMFRLSYLTMPRTYNGEGYSLGKKYYDEDIWTQDLDPIVWQESLKEWDYLYLKHVDEQFVDKYGIAFMDKYSLQDGQIYKIVIEDSGKIILEFLDMK